MAFCGVLLGETMVRFFPPPIVSGAVAGSTLMLSFFGILSNLFSAKDASTMRYSCTVSIHEKWSTKYIAYLFASLAGISKVGSYTGTGSNINVDCGFSAGARFVVIKRADGGRWYLFDSERGIISGNDPHIFYDFADEEVTNTDSIDPLNSGFTVTSSAPSGMNQSGDTYLFFAIA